LPWVITAIASWIIFYFLVDIWQLKRTIFGGLFTVALGSLVDWGGQQLNLYKFYDIIINWAGCSMFYVFGPVFTVGILFTQYLPRNRTLQVINILVVSLLYVAMESLILQTKAAEYKHWHILASYAVNVGALTVLTWVAQTFNLAPNCHRYYV